MSQNQNVNGPLVWSGLFIGAAVVVLAFMMPSLGNALFGPAVDEPETLTRIAKYLDQHEERQDDYQERFGGRSVFFKPVQPVVRRPSPEPTRTAPKIDEPREPAQPAPKQEPKRPAYSGPSIQAIIGEEVWFQGTETRVKVGETDKGLTVLSTNPPWTVQVEYRGWEYELSLFNANKIEEWFITDPKPTPTFPGLVDVPDEDADTPVDETEPAPDVEEEPVEESPVEEDETPVVSPDDDPARPPRPKPTEEPDSGDPEKDTEGESEKPDADDEGPSDDDE